MEALNHNKTELQTNKPAPLPVKQWLTQPEQRLREITAVSLEEAVKCESAVIAIISKEDKGVSRSIITMLLNDVIDFLNLGNTMDGRQLVQTVDLIINDSISRNLKPEDLKVCFDNAKKGMYGKNYNRIDGQIIFEWIYAYAGHRQDYVEQLNIKAHNETIKRLKSDEAANPEGQARVIQIFKEAAGEVEPEKEETFDTFVPAPLVLDEKNAYAQECFSAFDKEYKANGVKGPVRCINYNGKAVDQVEFTELKLKERGL